MSDSRILKSPTDYPRWLSRFHDVAGKLYDYASPRSVMTKEEAILPPPREGSLSASAIIPETGVDRRGLS